MLPEISICFLRPEDIPAVARIARSSFKHPWDEEQFRRVLAQMNDLDRLINSGIVARREEQTVGFAIYEPQLRQVALLNMAVHPDARRCGVGRHLVAALTFRPERQNLLSVVVRENNLEAQLFFRTMGLEATETWRQYFDDTGEDAYLMEGLQGLHFMPLKGNPRYRELPPTWGKYRHIA